MRAGTWSRERHQLQADYKTPGEYALKWGHDIAFGSFIQVWRLTPEFDLKDPFNQPDETNLLIDLDESDGPLPDHIILEIAHGFGFQDLAQHHLDDPELEAPRN